MDWFIPALQLVLVLILIALVFVGGWAFWLNPGYYLLGAGAGALLIAAIWAIIGTLVIALTGKAMGERSFYEMVAPAWPLFISVLSWSALVGALVGGLGGSILLGDLPWERNAERKSGRNKPGPTRENKK